MNLQKFDSKFQQELENFYSFMMNISLWFLSLRYKGGKPNHKNVNLKKICGLSDDVSFAAIDEKEYIKELEKMCGVKTPKDYGSLRIKFQQKLNKLEPKKYIRGKFELWFFIEFIKQTLQSLEESVLEEKEKISIYTQITHSNAIEILGPRAKLPISLQDFLIRNLS